MSELPTFQFRCRYCDKVSGSNPCAACSASLPKTDAEVAVTIARDAAVAEVERLRGENERLTRRNAELTASEERMASATRIAEANRRMVCKLAADRETERDTLQARVAELERERDEWKRQHDRVLSQAQRDFDRAHMADTYEQWLLDLGNISGCGHVDERLPRCIEEAFETEHERATAAEQQVTALRNGLKPEHKCRCIARIHNMTEGREWWLGELTEKVLEWPWETHCLHIKTPLKDIVLLCNMGDLQGLTVLCDIPFPIKNPRWKERMEAAYRCAALGRGSDGK